MSMIKRKTIVFNMEDPLQAMLYKHVCKFKNFSYYGKSLIQKDYDSGKFPDSPGDGIEVRIGQKKYL
jgi:hypothetical protein